MHLRSKNPLKSNTDIQEMLNNKMSGIVNDDEWTDIIRYMYNENDANLLQSIIKDIIQRKKVNSRPDSRQRLTRAE